LELLRQVRCSIDLLDKVRQVAEAEVNGQFVYRPHLFDVARALLKGSAVYPATLQAEAKAILAKYHFPPIDNRSGHIMRSWELLHVESVKGGRYHCCRCGALLAEYNPVFCAFCLPNSKVVEA
jgi:hypothetical protein